MTRNAFSLLEQFTKWPYPDGGGFPAGAFSGGFRDYDLVDDHAIIWPSRPYQPATHILVAGCGTSEAAVLAFNNPKAHVTGIDISPESLERTRRLKQKFGLDNLHLTQMDLHDAKCLEHEFDLVISYGVIHHLPEPHTAIAALGQVLKHDGAMLISIYRHHPRLGVYMVQEALRRLDVGFSSTDVAFTRSVLASLTPGHHLFANTPRKTILNGSDTDIVDTFLNRHDQAFSVPEVLGMVERSGLAFQCWFDNLEYYADAYFDPKSELGQRVSCLPQQEQWAIVELLCQVPGRHRLVLRKTADAVIDIGKQLSAAGALSLRPKLRRNVRLVSLGGKKAELQREWHRLPLSPAESAIVSAFGTDDVQQIVRSLGLPAHGQLVTLQFIERLWRLGHVIVSI